MQVTATIGQIKDAGLWDEYCELTGCNPWAANEGRVAYSEVVEVPLGIVGRMIEFLPE